jgi:hypothetical protein
MCPSTKLAENIKIESIKYGEKLLQINFDLIVISINYLLDFSRLSKFMIHYINDLTGMVYWTSLIFSLLSGGF